MRDLLSMFVSHLRSAFYIIILLAAHFSTSSETQGRIVGVRKSLNGRVVRRNIKNEENSLWGQCFTRPVPNGRGHSGFWLLVAENFCVFLPNLRAADLRVVSWRVFLHAKYMKFSCLPRLSWLFGGFIHDVKRFSIRTKWEGKRSELICDYLTGKYAGRFAGITTIAYLKVCETIHRFPYVFWMQGDIYNILESLSTTWPWVGVALYSVVASFFLLISWITYFLWLKLWQSWQFFCRTGQALHVLCRYVERSEARHVPTVLNFLSVPKSKNSVRVYFHKFTNCAQPFSLKLKPSIYW